MAGGPFPRVEILSLADATQSRLARIVAQADEGLASLAIRRRLGARVREAARRRARQTALLFG
jgi:hypothetical protein